MKILLIGLDISITSTGMFSYLVDSKTFNIIEHKWAGFTDTIRDSKLYPGNLYFYKPKKSDYYIKKYVYCQEKIIETIKNWISDVVADEIYVGIEDYSFGSSGLSFNIGEFTGYIKRELYLYGLQFKLYDISVIKMFATDNGNATKEIIYENFKINGDEKLKLELGNLRPCYSPHADIVDAFYITTLMRTDLMINRHLVPISEIPSSKIQNMFTKVKSKKVKKKTDVCLLDKKFIIKEI